MQPFRSWLWNREITGHFFWISCHVAQVLTTNLPSHVVFYWENLDLARFEGTSYRADLEDWLRNKYQGHKMDAIVASGETSIDYVLKVRRNVWPGCR